MFISCIHHIIHLALSIEDTKRIFILQKINKRFYLPTIKMTERNMNKLDNIIGFHYTTKHT